MQTISLPTQQFGVAIVMQTDVYQLQFSAPGVSNRVAQSVTSWRNVPYFTLRGSLQDHQSAWVRSPEADCHWKVGARLLLVTYLGQGYHWGALPWDVTSPKYY